jgi:hypothetical protein
MQRAAVPHIRRVTARPPNDQRTTHDRRLYLRRHPHAPRGKGRKDGRALHEVTAARLSAFTLNTLKERNNLDGHAVEDVIWGNVTQVGEQGGCLARTAVLASDLDERIPGLAINRFCASRAGGGEPRRQPGQGRRGRRPISPAGSR